MVTLVSIKLGINWRSLDLNVQCHRCAYLKYKQASFKFDNL